MAWRPSIDATFNGEVRNALWEAIEPIYDTACSLSPVSRHATFGFGFYLVRRRGDDRRHLDSLGSRVPPAFRAWPLGSAELELLDFLLNYEENRVLSLQAPRGAGKTSLLAYVGHVLSSTDYPRAPLLLVVDGARRPDGPPQEAFVRLLREALRESMETAPLRFRGALSRSVDGFGSVRTTDEAVEACSALVAALPGADPSALTLAFDNLDHLEGEDVDAAVDLARQLHQRCRVGTVVALRPGSRAGVVGRGSARAFFHFVQAVYAPDVGAWLGNLPKRLREAAVRQHERADRMPQVVGQHLSPDLLEEIGLRFASLLDERTREALATLAADDVRHLIRFVRRILSHRDLPVGWLLPDGRSESPPQFHGLRAMFEGILRFYRGDRDIPNVTFFESQDGVAHFLLPHRVLVLLGSGRRRVPTDGLLAWLGELYPQDQSIECIRRLREGGLLAASDHEVATAGQVLPDSFSLTMSGQYYVNTLLRSPDYLLAVALDAPLRHAAILESSDLDTFTKKLASVEELVIEVMNRESREVSDLVRRKPNANVSKLADSLSRGGTLGSALLSGLEQLVARGQHSERDAVVRKTRDLGQTLLPRARKWLAGIEERLHEVANRGRKHDRMPPPVAQLSMGSAHVRIDALPSGDDIDAKVEVNAGDLPSRAPQSIVVVYRGVSPAGPAAQVAVASQVQPVPPRYRAPFPLAPAAAWPRGDAPTAFDILFLDRGPSRGGLAVLDASGAGDIRPLRLYPTCPPSMEELGTIGGAVLSEAEDQVSKVTTVAQTRPEDISEAIQVAGSALARRALSARGHEMLAFNWKSLNDIVVVSDQCQVPWEWLCPSPQGVPMEPLMTQWSMTRWQYSSDPTLAALVPLFGPVWTAGPVSDLRAAGLGASGPSDGGVRKLFTSLDGCHCAHLVGHHDNGTLHIGSVEVSVNSVLAFPAPSVGSVVLSACSPGAAPLATNLAATMSKHWCCPVFAPLVDILKSQSEMVQACLSECIRRSGADASIDDIIRQARAEEPLFQTYVRFGVFRQR